MTRMGQSEASIAGEWPIRGQPGPKPPSPRISPSAEITIASSPDHHFARLRINKFEVLKIVYYAVTISERMFRKVINTKCAEYNDLTSGSVLISLLCDIEDKK